MLKNEKNLTRNLRANIQSLRYKIQKLERNLKQAQSLHEPQTEEVPFEKFSQRMTFLRTYRNSFLQQLPMELQIKIRVMAQTSSFSDLIGLQLWMQQLPNDSRLWKDLCLIQQIDPFSEMAYPLLVQLDEEDTSVISPEFISKLFFAGFVHKITTRSIPDMFGPTVKLWCKRHIYSNSEEDLPWLFFSILSSIPKFNDEQEPAKHHIILDFKPSTSAMFTNNIKHGQQFDEMFLNHKRTFSDFPSNTFGLDLLIQTKLICLWVQRGTALLTRTPAFHRSTDENDWPDHTPDFQNHQMTTV